MLSSRNKRLLLPAAFLFSLIFSITVSCALIDLRGVGVETYPASAGIVLPVKNTPLSVRFETDVEKVEAEAAFSVTSESGSVEGDLCWDGSGFHFTPISGWKSGVRYRMALSGSIRAIDGREARPAVDLSFYAIRSGGAPSLVSCYPKDGAVTGVCSDDGARIELTFSEAMDERKTEDALSLQPAVELFSEWNSTRTVLTAKPKAALSPCVVYRWTLSADAQAFDGSPLAREELGSFSTDADATPPAVARTYPAVASGGTWTDAGGTLSDLDVEQAVIVEFSEAMETSNMQGSVSFSPPLSGRTDVLDPRRIVFIPDENPESGTPLTLIVSADAADRSGLRMGSEYRESFVPAIPALRVLRVEATSGESLDSPLSDSLLSATVSDVDGLLSLSIRFSTAFPLASRVASLSKIALDAYFPGSLSSPVVRSVSWPSSDTALFVWEGLEKSPLGYANFYELKISGGRAGVAADMDLKMKEDLRLLVEAKR
ncbi:MAG: Ig-like domain-containing protein [Treponemataceae bacterium]